MGTFLRVMAVFVLVFVVFQFIPFSDKSNPPVDKKLEIKVPTKVANIFKKSCYDCHSNETKWPWWSSVAPASWSIIDDVVEGRKALNFSTWNNYSQKRKDKLKKGIYRTIMGPMPLPQYVLLHPNAKLTDKEINILRDWASDGKGFIKTSVR